MHKERYSSAIKQELFFWSKMTDYICKICGEEFESSYAFHGHLRNIEKISAKNYYDKFISTVGEGIRNFLLTQKMLPSSIDEIWADLENERGSRRDEGETYTSNILRRLRQRLDRSEHGENLNRYFQKYTETEWTKMINKTLQFFGE